MNRKTARENAFILVFEKNFRDEPLTSIIEDAIEARNFEYDDYVEKVFCGIFDNLSEIDAKITENLRGWKLTRISKVSLSLMRIAVYEMLYMDDIPHSVSINEAVTLAKKYSTQDDSSFINGVLGSISKTVESR
ncbi:MAG: transcription antitermination factor NusB [Acutalibacteraceae bacterium]|nr:transcription antitermination factor NusB [Acutalibacteraceae bacterium]